MKRSSRRGASILEVLFAILITTIGLLGAVAVFPLAGSYARKARQYDAMSSAGRAAVGHFDARGMRRATERWMVWNTTTNQYERFTITPGLSYCLDPRFVAANNTNNTTAAAARIFPYSAQAADPQMFRLTLWSGLNNAAGQPQAMNALMANSIFRLDDDLTYLRPGTDPIRDIAGLPALQNDRSLPAVQFPAMSPDGTFIARRQSDGMFSWMATLVPKIDRTTVVAGSDLYVLSIVMFYQRPTVDLATDTPGGVIYEHTERVLNASILDQASNPIGDGVGGGTLRLTVGPAGVPANFGGTPAEAKEYLRVRPGDWLLLAGRENIGGTLVNRFKWYRVSDCDSEPNNLGGGNFDLYVSLVGQDWETFSAVSNPRAIILDGVIGVFEKTIRLEAGGAM